MARKTTFLAGLIFLLSSLLFAQGEFYGPVYIIGDDGRLYIDHIPDTITASYLAVIDDGWVKKLDIDNLELDTSNIAGLYDYLNAKSDTGHVHDTSDVTNLSLYLGQKLDVTDTSNLARKVHIHDTSDVTNLSLYLGQKLDVTDTSDLARKVHNHLRSDITDFWSTDFWLNIPDKPSVFPPDAHGHTLSEVLAAGKNGSDSLPLLQIYNDTVAYLGSNYRHKLVLASIDNPQWRSNTGHYDLWNENNFNPDTVANINHVHDTSDVTNLSLYLGQKLDVTDTSVLARKVHDHDATDINSGTLSNSRLSFNPDYFVQGETIRRSVNFNAANPIDNFKHSTLFRIDTDDPANPTGTEQYYGVKIQHPTADNYSVEIAGRIDNEKLLWGGLNSSGRQPWREIWHSGNLDTANIVNTEHEQSIDGTKHFNSKVYAQGGVYTTYNVGSNNHYWRFRDGLFLYYMGSQIMGCNPVTGNKLKWEVPFDIRDKVEISDTLMLGNKAVSGDNIVAQYIKNNSVSDSTSASINFGLAQSAGYHHAAIKGMRTNKGAGHASSIYLQARPAVSGEGTGHLEDVVEAGFDDQQAFVKYHNNPPVIHSEYENIGSSSQTLNPTKGVYICEGAVPRQEIRLGTTGVENGQTVKILKMSNSFAGVRYGPSNNYHWREIGDYGAAEFIYYEGVWFCHGAEYIL